MIYFKKSDLVFIAKLKFEVNLTAKPLIENKLNKKVWCLEIETKNNEMIEKGVLVGARGEIRYFKQLNAMDALLKEMFPSGTKFNVIL